MAALAMWVGLLAACGDGESGSAPPGAGGTGGGATPPGGSGGGTIHSGGSGPGASCTLDSDCALELFCTCANATCTAEVCNAVDCTACTYTSGDGQCSAGAIAAGLDPNDACALACDGEGACEPSHPCTDGTHDCDANATCIPEGATYTCACDEGYVGDGTECEPLDDRTWYLDCDEGSDAATGHASLDALASLDELNARLAATPLQGGHAVRLKGG